MSYFHFRKPLREEYDTEEDYQDALKFWEYAEDQYEDDFHDRIIEERE